MSKASSSATLVEDDSATAASDSKSTLQMFHVDYTLYSIFTRYFTAKPDQGVATEETDQRRYETLREAN